MSNQAKRPPFFDRHPILARFANWPVMCAFASAAFLGTVYVLGDFERGTTVKGKKQDAPVLISATGSAITSH